MLTSPAFEEIDRVIATFLQSIGERQRIKLETKPQSDWIEFEWRQLAWRRDGMEIGLELYPNFGNAEQITGWTLYGFCYYDKDGWRHYLKRTFLDAIPLSDVTANLSNLLPTAFEQMQAIDSDDVPSVVALL